MPGAQVTYLSQPSNVKTIPNASATAQTVFDGPCDMNMYRPSGEDRTLMADVVYHFKMFDNTKVCRWDSTVHGTVVTEGLNLLLDYTLKSGSGGVPAWYVGLVDGTTSPVIAAADVMNSHAGWAEESADYSQGTRPVLTLGTIASGAVDNSASLAQFSFTGSGTVSGAFITSSNTKGGTSGLLYDVGLFADGPRNYGNGWQLYLSVTCSISAA